MEIKLNSANEILKRLKLDGNGEVQTFYTATCQKHMDKYVPKDIGNLRDNLDIGIDYITYESPYAEYQYNGHRRDGTRVVRNYTTPRYWTILG